MLTLLIIVVLMPFGFSTKNKIGLGGEFMWVF